jgi:hypothetical protein
MSLRSSGNTTGGQGGGGGEETIAGLGKKQAFSYIYSKRRSVCCFGPDVI